MKAMQAPDALAKGTILAGRYMLEEAIGSGGFGITYRARTLPFPGEEVALKEFFPRAVYLRSASGQAVVRADQEAVLTRWTENFDRECGLMSALRGNRAIVNVRETFRDPVTETRFLVMDFVPGETMEQSVKEGRLLSGEQIERMLKPFLPELARMHHAGILHRDINPGNLMLTPDGGLKLIDFGSAREIPEKGGRLTTLLRPGFAPPEQYNSRGGQGPATDVYALCASLYYALSGVIPPEGRARMLADELCPLEKMKQVHAGPSLIRTIERGMRLPREERPQSFEEMYSLLYPAENREAAGARKAVNRPAAAPQEARGSGKEPENRAAAPLPAAGGSMAARTAAAKKAARWMAHVRKRKYEAFLQELDRMDRMPETAGKRVQLEEAVLRNGKGFAMLTAWMT